MTGSATLERDASGHPHGELRPPRDTTGLAGVFRRRYLLRLLVRKELRVRYRSSVLGMFWSYGKPTTRFFTYFIVLGVILGFTRNTPNFALHIFAGMIVVHAFTETLGAGTKSVIKNKSLVRKMNVPREMFPVASLLVTLYHMVPQYVVMGIVLVFTGWRPDATALAAGLMSIVLIVLLSLAVGLACSALSVFFRDFANLIELLSMLVTWSTPMIYTFERVARVGDNAWFNEVYLANPVTEAVLLSQRCFWIPSLPPDEVRPLFMPDHLFTRGFIMIGISLVLVYLAQLLFTRLESNFAEHL
ncbi:MAG TPA: ABC transporter permease [Nocardioidaceae bacterium]|jgi:ABC-2 type transport system permease protein|nr:ABC transporter permease [Nocardioidaceae bacterium]